MNTVLAIPCLLKQVSLLLISLIAPTAALAGDALPIQPFEARYKVYAVGFPLGEAVLKLTDSGEGRYRMGLKARPKNVAKLLLPTELGIQASGRIRKGIVHPEHYEEKVTGRDVATTRLRFYWGLRQLHAQSGTKRATTPLSVGILDPLSMILVVMRDLQRGRRHLEYSLAHETEVKKYRVKVAGEETIPTAGLGKLRTLRITQRKAEGHRVTSFWFAPELNYLLVQAERKSKGRVSVRLSIDRTSYAH